MINIRVILALNLEESSKLATMKIQKRGRYKVSSIITSLKPLLYLRRSKQLKPKLFTSYNELLIVKIEDSHACPLPNPSFLPFEMVFSIY